MHYLSQLTKSDLENKVCLLRVNLDAKPDPDEWRFNRVVPTIEFLIKNGAKIIVFGHRGRPQGKDPNLSVEPVIDILSQKVGQKLEWLENMRFDSREQAGDKSLAQEVAAKGDLFINDDFATAHRASGTIKYLPEYLPSYAGLLMEKELQALSKVKEAPDKPLVVIIGGIKMEDKVKVIEHLYDKVDYFLMGSTYRHSEHFSRHPELVSGSIKIVIPEDYVLGGDGEKLDIGPKTIEKYKKLINEARTVFWNGPMGKFEDDQYRCGSAEIARAVAAASAFTVVGGGDTVKSIKFSGVDVGKFGFVSTGGGAMLSFLGGEELPGIKALSSRLSS